ncbi:MAG TPA: helix-turn-helix domain-containing protein [Myxococcota bacterium]
MADPELLTTAQVLALLQIGRTKLWELVREAAFPAYRIGEGRNSSLRYRRADVLGWLERNRVNGARRVAGPEPETLPPPRAR